MTIKPKEYARPMLAHDEVVWNHKKMFPCFVSPKIDGIRGRVIDGTLLSRTAKRFRNEFTHNDFSHEILDGLDGELVAGTPWDKHCLENTKSAITSLGGQPGVMFYVFDDFTNPALIFSERLIRLQERVAKIGHPRIQVVPQWMARTQEEVLQIEQYVLGVGYEGLILKLPEYPYKHGRATPRNPSMMKLKRFTDAEARIVGYYEEMENTNPQTENDLGYSTRSSHQAGMVGKGRLGGFELRFDGSNDTFRCGSGFTAEQREYFWLYRDQCIGHLAKIKHFEHGAKDAPRHCTFLGIRTTDVEG